MLDANLKAQLKSYLERVTQPIEIVASLDDGAKSQEMLELLKEVASLSTQITLLDNGDDARKPSFSINRPVPISVCVLPASRWATNSPRWCWLCCKSAATLRKPALK